ncbi:MAG: DUF116 domain-containing protein [Candidatus Eisenbacteria bacterium]
MKKPAVHLGDAWSQWDGDLSSYEWKVETSHRPFLIFFALFCIALVGIGWLLWYLVVPRLAELHPRAPFWTGVAFLVGGGGVVLVSLSVILSVLTDRRLLLTRLALVFLVLAVRPTARIAQRFGFSRDRVENSFLKIHNTVTRLIDSGEGYDRILVLLPRCLSREARSRLVALAEKHCCRLYTAAGGSEALLQIRALRPKAIVAVACERDLVAGIRDAGTGIPVIGVPNIRENGPCWKANVDYREFEKAIRYFTHGFSRGEI